MSKYKHLLLTLIDQLVNFKPKSQIISTLRIYLRDISHIDKFKAVLDDLRLVENLTLARAHSYLQKVEGRNGVFAIKEFHIGEGNGSTNLASSSTSTDNETPKRRKICDCHHFVCWDHYKNVSNCKYNHPHNPDRKRTRVRGCGCGCGRRRDRDRSRGRGLDNFKCRRVCDFVM